MRTARLSLAFVAGLFVVGAAAAMAGLGAQAVEGSSCDDAYRVVDAKMRVGTFGTVQGASLTGGRKYNVLYGASTVTLPVAMKN